MKSLTESIKESMTFEANSLGSADFVEKIHELATNVWVELGKNLKYSSFPKNHDATFASHIFPTKKWININSNSLVKSADLDDCVYTFASNNARTFKHYGEQDVAVEVQSIITDLCKEYFGNNFKIETESSNGSFFNDKNGFPISGSHYDKNGFPTDEFSSEFRYTKFILSLPNQLNKNQWEVFGEIKIEPAYNSISGATRFFKEK